MPVCRHCWTPIPEMSQICPGCGLPRAEAVEPPPSASPSPAPKPIPFGAKLAISAATLATAVGVPIAALSPNSPLRNTSNTPPPSIQVSTSQPADPVTGSTVVDGVTLSAEVHDEDLYYIDEVNTAYTERGLPVPADLTSAPVHAGRFFMVQVTADPVPADPAAHIVSASMRDLGPLECSYDNADGWLCTGTAPLTPGPIVIDIAYDNASLELPLQVLEAPGLMIDVDPPPIAEASGPVTLSGTITNRSRISIAIDFDGFSVEGLPECNPWLHWPEPGNWDLFLEGETRPWSCAVTAPATEGSYVHTVNLADWDTGAIAVEFTLEVGPVPILEALERWWLGEYGEPNEAVRDVDPYGADDAWDHEFRYVRAAGLDPEPWTWRFPAPLQTVYRIGWDLVTVGVFATPEDARAAFEAVADDAAGAVGTWTGTTWCETGSSTFYPTQIGGNDAFVVAGTGKALDTPADYLPGVEERCNTTEAEFAQYHQGLAFLVDITTEDWWWIEGRTLVVIRNVSAVGSYWTENWGGYWGLEPLAQERLFAELEGLLP